jgi:hypothetical protein
MLLRRKGKLTIAKSKSSPLSYTIPLYIPEVVSIRLWILKNSKELLENLNSNDFSKLTASKHISPHFKQQFFTIN